MSFLWSEFQCKPKVNSSPVKDQVPFWKKLGNCWVASYGLPANQKILEEKQNKPTKISPSPPKPNTHKPDRKEEMARSRVCSSVVDPVSSRCEALGSDSSTKTEKRKEAFT